MQYVLDGNLHQCNIIHVYMINILRKTVFLNNSLLNFWELLWSAFTNSVWIAYNTYEDLINALRLMVINLSINQSLMHRMHLDIYVLHSTILHSMFNIQKNCKTWYICLLGYYISLFGSTLDRFKVRHSVFIPDSNTRLSLFISSTNSDLPCL